MNDIEKTIDAIEAVRARNNTAWMNLVRLVMRVAPEEARKIFAEIEENDLQILRLNGKLAKDEKP